MKYKLKNNDNEDNQTEENKRKGGIKGLLSRLF